MRNDYNETSKDADLQGLEDAVREHAQRLHRQEREAIVQGTVILFPVHKPEPQTAA